MLGIVLEDPDIDTLIVTFTPPAADGAEEIARAVAEAAAVASKPVLANFIVTDGTVSALRSGPKRVPWFSYPESAARALARVAPYAEWVQRPEGDTPSFEDLDVDAARQIVEAALAGPPGAFEATAAIPSVRLSWLDAASAFRLLEAYGIPVVPSALVNSAAQAVEAAGSAGYPVAVKLDAPGLLHKSDVGGVRLNLGSAEEVAAVAEALLARFGPGVSLVVQPMAPDGVETVVGLVEDPSFGPLVMFGLGGKQAELLRDQMWSLVPMTTQDARQLVGGLRSSPLFTGYRGSALVELSALAEMLSRVARLAEDIPEVVELSLNPVVASAEGAIVLDARVRVSTAPHEPFLLRRVMRTA